MSSKNDLDLVRRLLALPSLTSETRGDLMDFQRDLRGGMLAEDDRHYLRALAERLLGPSRGGSGDRRARPGSDQAERTNDMGDQSSAEPIEDLDAGTDPVSEEQGAANDVDAALKQARLETLAEVKRIVATLRDSELAGSAAGHQAAREAVLDELSSRLEELDDGIRQSV